MTIEESFTAARQFVEARFASYPPEACAVLIAAYVNATGGKVAAPAKQAKKQMEVEPLPDGPDQVARFVKSECSRERTAQAKSTSVYARYSRWAKEQGFRVLCRNAVFTSLHDSGLRRIRTHNGRFFMGLKLNGEEQ